MAVVVVVGGADARVGPLLLNPRGKSCALCLLPARVVQDTRGLASRPHILIYLLFFIFLQRTSSWGAETEALNSRQLSCDLLLLLLLLLEEVLGCTRVF